MKPLVGKRRSEFFALLRRADSYLFMAQKLAYRAYGSHLLSMDIDRARDVTRFGYQSIREKHQYMKANLERITPPDTPKVKRMKEGWA